METVKLSTSDGGLPTVPLYQRGVWAVTQAIGVGGEPIADSFNVTHAPSGLGGCATFLRWPKLDEAKALVDDLVAAGLDQVGESAELATEPYLGARLFGADNWRVVRVFKRHKWIVDERWHTETDMAETADESSGAR